MTDAVLIVDDTRSSKDMIILVLNAVIEFIFEGFKRDA
jgi:hypothetical protein